MIVGGFDAATRDSIIVFVSYRNETINKIQFKAGKMYIFFLTDQINMNNKVRKFIFPQRYKCSFLVTSLLLLHGLLGGLGLLAFGGLGCGGLDDSNSHGLSHVSDSESSQWRIVGEGLDTHGLAGGQQDDGGISRLDELGVVLHGLTGTTVNLLLDLSKLKE